MDLLEREHSLAVLRNCPPGRVVLVAGEAGIGKTSLVRTFCAETDPSVLYSSCEPLSMPPPLGPLRDMARQSGGELARTIAADSPRHQIFAAFLDYLSQHETVAVFEDVHWADEASHDLLLFICRRVNTTRSLLVVTYRDDEIGPDDPLRRLLGALATDRSVQRIRLSPLSPEAVATLADPHGLDAAELYARTGGNPFFVTEVLADPDPGVPATVRDAVLARVAALGAPQRSALEAVAIFPGGTPLALVRVAPEDMDACVSAGMLTRDGTRVRFRHELARLAVEKQITPARKASLHAYALADLESSGAEPAQLVYHAQMAGDEMAVLVHAEAAAERATQMGAHRQAAEHYAQALRLADRLPLRHRAELLERYADTCAGLYWDDLAVDASRQALECWRKEADLERQAALLASRSHYLWNKFGNCSEVHESVGEALRLAEQLPPGRGLVAAYTWSAVILVLARDIPKAIKTGEYAIQLAERFQDPALLARALNAVGTAQWFNDPDVAEKTLIRSLDVARQVGNDTMIAAALVNLGSGAGEIRRYAVAERWLRETIAWSSAHDMDGSRKYATAWLARCLFERGEWRKAAEMLDLDRGELISRSCNSITWLTVLGRLQTRLGDPAGRATLDEAWGLAAETGDIQHMWPVAAGRAELDWLTGRPIDSLVRDTYDFAVRIGHSWAIGELGQWFDGKAETVIARGALPYRLNPADRAKAWDDIGCPYEAALALTGSPDHLREARERFELLGARPAVDRVATMMRNLDVRTPQRSTLAHQSGQMSPEANVEESGAAPRSAGESGMASSHEANTYPGQRSHRRPPPKVMRFQREGRKWHIEMGDRSVVVDHCRGMSYLAILIANPGHEITALELAAGPGSNMKPVLAQKAEWRAQPVLDEKAIDGYRQRLAILQRELERADTIGDHDRAAQAHRERDWLLSELRSATGFAGRTGSFTTSDERARVAVGKAIRRALERIRMADPVVGSVLSSSIQTGRRCSYLPRSEPLASKVPAPRHQRPAD